MGAALLSACLCRPVGIQYVVMLPASIGSTDMSLGWWGKDSLSVSSRSLCYSVCAVKVGLKSSIDERLIDK